jgi:tetratricopeptide (TPR) repeat protein
MPGQIQSFSTAVSALAVALAIASVARAAPETPKEGARRGERPQTPKEGAGRADRPQTPKEGTGRASPRGQTEGELSPDAQLARAAAYYEAGQYAQCTDAFAGMLDDPEKVRALSPRSRDQAQVYDAACLIAIGKTDAANERFRSAIRENPQMAVPSAVVFPPAVIERFVVVRSELMEEIRRSEQERIARERAAAEEARKRAEAERRRVVMLEKLASEETLITRNRRWVASVPFGVGQFQNRHYTLGAIFLASETLLLATAITATSLELANVSEAQGGSGLTDPEAERVTKNIETAQIVSIGATGALLLVVAGGIVQANLAFVPEFRDGTRPRKIPKLNSSAHSLSVKPLVAPSAGGAAIGVTGAF